jgi:hypothetical protein
MPAIFNGSGNADSTAAFDIYSTQAGILTGGSLQFKQYPQEGITIRSEPGNYTNLRDDGRLQVIAVKCFDRVSPYIDALPGYRFLGINFMEVTEEMAAHDPDLYGAFVSLIFKREVAN